MVCWRRLNESKSSYIANNIFVANTVLHGYLASHGEEDRESLKAFEETRLIFPWLTGSCTQPQLIETFGGK